jgi:predicted Zn-dependent protease
MPRLVALEDLARKDPANGLLRYMLANEYLKAKQYEKTVASLTEYFRMAEDEGAGYRMLALALIALGREAEAKDAYRRGIEAARRHQHASMASEFEAALQDLP